MAVSGLQQRYPPMILTARVFAPWGPGVLTPWSYEEYEDGSLDAAEESKLQQTELGRSQSWGGFSTYTHKARYSAALSLEPQPVKKSASEPRPPSAHVRPVSKFTPPVPDFATGSDTSPKTRCSSLSISDVSTTESLGIVNWPGTDIRDSSTSRSSSKESLASHILIEASSTKKTDCQTLPVRWSGILLEEGVWDNYCCRVRGTFLEISVCSQEKEKQRVQKSRSSSVPPKAASKDWNSHDARVKNFEASQSDRPADGLDTNLVDMLDRGNTEPCRMDKMKQPMCQTDQAQEVAQKPPAIDEDNCTTLALRNLPYSLTREELLEAIDASGFSGLYNFVYLPHKFKEHRNLGFAFINFGNVDAAHHFHAVWHKSRHFKVKGSVKPLNVSVAAVQGRSANELKAHSRKMGRVKNTSYLPVMFDEAGIPRSIDNV